MFYTKESIKKASKMSKAALAADLERAGVLPVDGPLTRWSVGELVTVWLEKYGEVDAAAQARYEAARLAMSQQ